MLGVVVCYDIADDARRSDVSRILEELGPRVQYSVFECRVPHRQALDALLRSLSAVVDPIEDQIRVYVLGQRPQCPRIVGARVIEEWRDFWIV